MLAIMGAFSLSILSTSPAFTLFKLTTFTALLVATEPWYASCDMFRLFVIGGCLDVIEIALLASGGWL